MLAEGEQATGLQLPEDIETLLGDGITVSVDAGADLKALTRVAGPVVSCPPGSGSRATPTRSSRSSTSSRRPPVRAATW